MFGEHLEEVRNLMELKRYQNKLKIRERSVAEHSWFVSKVAHGLALWERDKFKDFEVDMEKVLFFAINHDIVESYTGDIISTTKDLFDIRRELALGEETIFKDQIANTIPNSWGNMYIGMNSELASLASIESKIVKAADIIDRVFECLEEINIGNKKYYEEILDKDLVRLFTMGLKSVNYFLKYSIYDLDGAEDYIPDFIKEELNRIDFSPYF